MTPLQWLSKPLIIHDIQNDETGDNAHFETKVFPFLAVKLIFHRDTYYVGGWNPQKKVIQIFGVNQLKKISIAEKKINSSKIGSLFEDEYNKRFGVTKNIDNAIYDIKLEMSPVLEGFIKSHHWHHSQKFSKKNNNVIMHLKCGINRELMEWLFQWMYNIRIIEPVELIEFYQKTIDEMQRNVNAKTLLMYKNKYESKP